MEIKIPAQSIIMMIGASGSGKSTFVNKYFSETEILSSDKYRRMIADAETGESTPQAFELLQKVLSFRSSRRLLSVCDCTSIYAEDRKSILDIANQYHIPVIAIVLDVSEKFCQENNKNREHPKQPRSINKMCRELKHLNTRKETIFYRYHLSEEYLKGEITVVREPSRLDKNTSCVDIIGDVHGCLSELFTLLQDLGYNAEYNHPEGRKLCFVGDLVDRTENSLKTLEFVKTLVQEGKAFLLKGNHEYKLERWLINRPIIIGNGMQFTIDNFEDKNEEYRKELYEFLKGLPSHLLFDNQNLVVTHAAMKPEMLLRDSFRVSQFTMYGETSGELDEYGFVKRLDWQSNYQPVNNAGVICVYGHNAYLTPQIIDKGSCKIYGIDTGCVFGGSLTSLRYTNGKCELVSVPAEREYYHVEKPLEIPKQDPVTEYVPDEVKVQDFLIKKVVKTGIGSVKVNIKQEQASVAFDTLVNSVVDHRWLVFVPPTTGTCESSKDVPNFLEYPIQALEHYSKNGVSQIIVEEKAMGSNATIVLCRDENVARAKFGDSSRRGIVYTKTCRPFFRDSSYEEYVLQNLDQGMQDAGLWDGLQTDFIVLQGELLPWSLIGQKLISNSFANVAVTGLASVQSSKQMFELATQRGLDFSKQIAREQQLFEELTSYEKSYKNYAQPCSGLTDIRLAPFHLVATSQGTWHSRQHKEMMQVFDKLADTNPGFFHKLWWMEVNLENEKEQMALVDRWLELDTQGQEGFVIKAPIYLPENFKVCPSIKCRNYAYLKIIYGFCYQRPEVLAKLKQNRSTGKKMQLARTGLALSLEACQLFCSGASLKQRLNLIHAAIAVNSDYLDPRL